MPRAHCSARAAPRNGLCHSQPLVRHHAETLSTLQWAKRAQSIINVATAGVTLTADAAMEKMAAMAKLQKQVISCDDSREMGRRRDGKAEVGRWRVGEVGRQEDAKAMGAGHVGRARALLTTDGRATCNVPASWQREPDGARLMTRSLACFPLVAPCSSMSFSIP